MPKKMKEKALSVNISSSFSAFSPRGPPAVDHHHRAREPAGAAEGLGQEGFGSHSRARVASIQCGGWHSCTDLTLVTWLRSVEFGVNLNCLHQHFPVHFMLGTPVALAWCCLHWEQLLLLICLDKMSPRARGGNRKPPDF